MSSGAGDSHVHSFRCLGLEDITSFGNGQVGLERPGTRRFLRGLQGGVLILSLGQTK